MSETLHCPKCGHEIDKTHPECPECGTMVRTDASGALSIQDAIAQTDLSAVKVIEYGRIQRSTYWAIVAPCIVLGLLVGSFVIKNMDAGQKNTALILALFAYILCSAVVIWATVRRLHDLDWCAWWAVPIWLVSLIPFGGLLTLAVTVVIGCLPGTPGTNRFGSAPTDRRQWKAEETSIAASFCGNCGEQLKPGQKFCAKCGTPV